MSVPKINLCLFLLMLLSCSKEPITQVNEEVNLPIEEPETFNYTSTAKYNLNIVYFIPKDVPNRIDSHKRLSEVFMHGQEFFKKNMKDYGFGDKTFNLLEDKDKNRVKIIYVEGKQNTSEYPYSGGAGKVMDEINTYFTANPNEKSSDHIIVIMPVKDIDFPNVPFYGIGRWCFALDYDEMDVKYFGGTSKLSTNATKWIGGLLHELGHGLNLPHNSQKVSDHQNITKGTALMGGGNYTYGSTPTFLTEASCAILNNNQVFNNVDSDFYNGASAQIKSIQGSFENEALIISGTFNSDIPVNYIGFYNDPADDNADYDAVTWASPVNNNSFNITMPISEFYKKGDTEYILRLRMCHVNGDISTFTYSYKFVDNIPVIAFGDKNYLDSSTWEIVYYSSQEDKGGEGTNGLASQIIDGDDSTYWHSCWINCNASYPHTLVVDATETITAKGFSFLQRNGSRKVKDIEILVSSDNNEWESKGDFTLKNINTIHHIDLAEETSFRYFKIIAKSAFDGQQFAALAEIKCF